ERTLAERVQVRHHDPAVEHAPPDQEPGVGQRLPAEAEQQEQLRGGERRRAPAQQRYQQQDGDQEQIPRRALGRQRLPFFHERDVRITGQLAAVAEERRAVRVQQGDRDQGEDEDQEEAAGLWVVGNRTEMAVYARRESA